MLFFMRFIYSLLLIGMILTPVLAQANDSINIPILCYHNFNPTVPGLMNLTPERLETQIQWLKENGYTFVPLQDVVEYLQGTRPSLPSKPIVITDDDGWQSVYTYLYPIAKKYNIPVTLFIYPETISTGKHALTWAELTELQHSGLFDIQAHTYSHPNFKIEKRQLSAENYEKFVKLELTKSKKILEEKLGKKITLLAWPFGIYDSYLDQEAEKAGYVMAFSIDARKANKSFVAMAQPRYMILQGLKMKTFENIMQK